MSNDEKILKRVKNLLDMANDSTSPHEAMIAAKRARALMDKHQISKDDLLAIDDHTFGVANCTDRYGNAPTWVRGISTAVGRLNDCQACYRSDLEGVIFRYRGFKSDAIIAKYTHDYLVDTCSRLLKNSGVKGRSERNFYRLGFARAIGRRIEVILKERHSHFKTSSGTDLVVLKLEMVSCYFDTLKSGRKPNTRPPTTREANAAAKGAYDAGRVSLEKQLQADAREPLAHDQTAQTL